MNIPAQNSSVLQKRFYCKEDALAVSQVTISSVAFILMKSISPYTISSVDTIQDLSQQIPG